jgi:hypothetical protein
MGTLTKGIIAVGAVSLAMLCAVACGKPSAEPTSNATTMAAALGAKASCDARPTQRTCSEFPDRKSFGVEKSLCEAMHGKFALGACPASAEEVGLCSLSDGETKRYYAPTTREEAKADCEGVSGAFR